MKTHIEVQPFEHQRGGGCHYAVVGPRGFEAGGCRSHIFEAVAAAFAAARLHHKCKSFAVVVL